MKIDCFAHICPPKFIDACTKQGVNWGGTASRGQQVGGPVLWDIDGI